MFAPSELLVARSQEDDVMAVIDAHTHIFPSEDAGRKAMRGASPTGYWGLPDDLLTLMKQAGINHAVTVGTLPVRNMILAANKQHTVPAAEHTRESQPADLLDKMVERLNRLNQFLCTQALLHQEFMPFVAVNPWIDTDRMMALLDDYHGHGIRGLKLHPPLCSFYPMDERLLPVYAWAQEKSLPVLFHGGRSFESPDIHYTHPSHFEPLAHAFPHLKIVVAHLAWDFFDEAVALSKRFDNVYFDTSFALSARSGPGLSDTRAVDLIRSIGVHKVFFGSDYPWSNPWEDLARIRSIGLTDTELDYILWLNAQECFSANR